MSGFEIRIKGFTSKEQAEVFKEWYSGQGEQDAYIWFETAQDQGRIDVSSMNCEDAETKWVDNTLEMVVKPL